MGKLQDVTGADFQSQVLQSDRPVLVLFSSEWCPACKQLAPVVEKMAGEVSDRAAVVHVDVSAEAELASTYGVMSIPTVIVFNGGEAGQRIVGYVQREELDKLLA